MLQLCYQIERLGKSLEYRKMITECLKYIEEQVEEPLTVTQIAEQFGYSDYHFLRIFKKETNVSLMEYVKERKLLHAYREIEEGARIIEIAFKYGYETHSGFTKAFRLFFGFSPMLLRALLFQKSVLAERGSFYMGKFLEETKLFSTKEELYKELIDCIVINDLISDQDTIQVAYELACRAHQDQFRKSGEEYVTHCLNVAILLAKMEADKNTILAGLLHDIIIEKTEVTIEEVKDSLGREISTILIELMDSYQTGKDLMKFSESVIMIRLADRLHNMRTLTFMDASRYHEKAKETIELFSPIAAKLELEKVKLELNELAIPFL